MMLSMLRILFFVLVMAVLFVNASSYQADTSNAIIILVIGLGIALTTFFVDVLTPKKSLAALAGVFFGLLVGSLISSAFMPLLTFINDVYGLELSDIALQAVRWVTALSICYLVISIVVRTKDDFRFIIPYVEFAKQTKGARPLILDTSAIIDGRIADLYKSNLFDAPLIVPRFVLNELQLISDSADRMKRQRGRRGLDILKTMQESNSIDVEIDDTEIADAADVKGVDQKLVVFAKACNGRIGTTDYNLTKVAQVREVDVVNINDLANSLKTIVIPGEQLQVKILKAGEESDQGVAYLEDGTMVVVEDGRNKIGREMVVAITSSLQTSAGKMIFGKFERFIQSDERVSSDRSGNGNGNTSGFRPRTSFKKNNNGSDSRGRSS